MILNLKSRVELQVYSLFGSVMGSWMARAQARGTHVQVVG